ncbi:MULTISPECIES: hypothetical protein [Buttiauxella]|uniref:hypothetical protein n=1 Tax=Buttiauxella TaxID=82976 RepID=UPI001065E4B2|nr:hypothetical protein [Buttiauxella sp. BIGb0552]TDX14789.1 hypothetical protein EDF88_4114 [Buttiauxella sp. BIGb0552]
MDNMIIGWVRIYFPRPGEKLPVPSEDIRTFAIKGTTGDRCCVPGFWDGNCRVLSLPEYENSGKAIMGAVRQGKRYWR